MTVRKFLNINTFAFTALLVMSHLCHASDVVEQSSWERFIQHPVAPYAPSVVLGGAGAKLFQYGVASDSNWCKAASLVPLTFAPVWATYVQSLQRKQYAKKKPTKIIDIKPRTSRWWFAAPPLATAGLITALIARNNSNWLETFLLGAGVAAHAYWAKQKADQEQDNDSYFMDTVRYRGEGLIMNLLKKNDFSHKKQDRITEDDIRKMRWVAKTWTSAHIFKPTVEEADNAIRWRKVLQKQNNNQENAKSIQLLNAMLQPKPDDAQSGRLPQAIIKENLDLLPLDNNINEFDNNNYTEIEDNLLKLIQKNKKGVIEDLFKEYPAQMHLIFKQYQKRTAIYEIVKSDVSSRKKLEEVIDIFDKVIRDIKDDFILKLNTYFNTSISNKMENRLSNKQAIENEIKYIHEYTKKRHPDWKWKHTKSLLDYLKHYLINPFDYTNSTEEQLFAKQTWLNRMIEHAQQKAKDEALQLKEIEVI